MTLKVGIYWLSLKPSVELPSCWNSMRTYDFLNNYAIKISIGALFLLLLKVIYLRSMLTVAAHAVIANNGINTYVRGKRTKSDLY